MKKEKYLAIVKNKKEKAEKRFLKNNKKQIPTKYRQDWRRLNASIKNSTQGVLAVQSWGKHLEKLMSRLNKKYPFLCFNTNYVLGQEFVSWEMKDK